MIAVLYVAFGVAVSLLALAAFGFALGFLIRAVAQLAESVGKLLPPTSQFLTDVTALREPSPTSAQMPQPYGSQAGAAPWPTRRDRGYGVAPPPVDTTSETGFTGPPVNAGDRDWFDEASLEALAQAQRPIAPGSRAAQPPPGPALDSER